MPRFKVQFHTTDGVQVIGLDECVSFYTEGPSSCSHHWEALHRDVLDFHLDGDHDGPFGYSRTRCSDTYIECESISDSLGRYLESLRHSGLQVYVDIIVPGHASIERGRWIIKSIVQYQRKWTIRMGGAQTYYHWEACGPLESA